MNEQLIADQLKASYRSVAARYRQEDEVHVTGEDHKRLCALLGMFSSSFRRPISVLDVGCGAGRYFHCVKNTNKLIGIDISPEMLAEARNPVRKEAVTVTTVELVCGSVYSAVFPKESFDLIYMIGVMGNGCGLSNKLLSAFHEWLRPDGLVFLDVFDWTTLAVRWKFKLVVRHRFPVRLRKMVAKISKLSPQPVPFHTYTQNEVDLFLRSSGLFPLAVYPQHCQTPLGPGRKLYCLGRKVEITKAHL